MLLSKDRESASKSRKDREGSVLYIEDDLDTRELVSLLLRLSNYEVVVAENYDDALSKARARHFDLYLIDNWIAGGSGINLCKRLREFNRLTPVLFYSGAAYESDKQQAFAAGAQAYLVKPAEPDNLIAEVSRLLNSADRDATCDERDWEPICS